MNPEPIDISVTSVQSLPEDPKSEDSKLNLISNSDFLTLIHRWQPMGYRVVINLPFVSDDINPLFAIKVTPYIPPVIQRFGEPLGMSGDYYSPIYPSPAVLSATSMAVTVTRYDTPPSLACTAAAYRFWRGAMKYRLRCVSNFAAQGYVIITTAKGLVASELHDQTSTLKNTHRHIQGLDVGAKRWMANGYLMSDISFFRHNEVTVPFEYPVPFFDNFRACQEINVMRNGVVIEVNCPDNFIVVYNRGGITGSTAGAQVVYELEYAPGDDMEFSSQIAYSRQYLELNNFNISDDLNLPPTAVPNLPFTYPAYT